MEKYSRNELIEIRKKVDKRDKGRCCKCGGAGEIIRSGKDFNFMDYFTGVSKPYVGAMITVCNRCNTKMILEKRGADGLSNPLVPYIAITSNGEIVEFR
ncbi:MAG: hypothetical protein K5879_00495 [Lachnospiraceae bacterium]|nr:hypothetical protein [Lachnospiraceae bacterium]